MKRSTSRASLFSADRSTQQVPKIDPAQICRETQTLLTEASRVLPYNELEPITFRVLKELIRRAETENSQSQSVLLKTIKECVDLYGQNLELMVRTLLLEVQCNLNSHMLDGVGAKLERTKHTLIDTPLEYLLPKTFLLEQRYHIACGDEVAAITSLRKCIELNEALLSEYLQDSQEVRQEIVDHVILAHYQLFRLRKGKKLGAALESLSKAVGAARRSYGPQNGVVRALQGLYAQQEQLGERGSTRSRAITEIVELQGRKGVRASAFYSWEDGRLVAQLLRLRDGQWQVLHQISYQIKLDISKLKLLRAGEWMSVEGGKIGICEEELLRTLDAPSQPVKETTTRIEMRNLSRDLVIRKDELSSSDDSEDFFDSEQFKFLKHNRAQSSKKYKETQ